MLRHAIMRGRTERGDYVALMVWPDEATYDAWHHSLERQRLFADQPHYLAREPTRRYELVDAGEATRES